ncbi:MAG: PPA1309 family protein, partial [Arachnia sp.]
MADNDPSRLIACLADIERHVFDNGWDQPARLFALVATSALLEVEPQLKGRVPESAEDALTAVEQDDFAGGVDVLERLQQIFFPESVDGVAVAMERTFL